MENKSAAQYSLKQSEVNQLLKLQELFHSHYLTEQLLNAMVGLYVKFVQNIQHNKHPIRVYFMEKIKFVLSRPEVIKLLEKDSVQNNRNMRQTIRQVVGLSAEEQMEMRKITQEAKREVQKNHLINNEKSRGQQNERSDALKQKERNIKIEMQMRIMEEVQNNMKQLHKDFSQEGEKQKKKGQKINNMVQKQDASLNQRLARRKKKLRKRSVDFRDKEVIQVQAPPPIAKAELIEMKNEIRQTYERFTRLTANKTKRGTQRNKQAEGRVKVKMEQIPIEEQDVFDQLQKKQKPKAQQQSMGFSKKKKVSEIDTTLEKKQQPKKQSTSIEQKAHRENDTSIDFKPFDRKTGRVTVRNKQYEEIDDDEAF